MKFPFYFILLLFFSNNVFSQVNFTDSNLPIIVINTNGNNIANDLKITADMGIVFNGSGVRNNLTDNFNEYDGKIGIEFRGSSSFALYDKKGYSLETRNDDGSNNNVPLLGMPKENDWVLHGPYGDKTLIRNVLAYKIAGDLMDYAPRTQLVELVLNDDYKGIYLFTEKIKRDAGRVDVSKLNPDENSGDDLTGGYILKIDKTNGEQVDGWLSKYGELSTLTSKNIFYQYHYPKPDNISTEQKEYIKDWMDNFDAILASRNYDDPVDGYMPLIDVKSFIRFIFVNEISRNVDGYRLSTFFYKDKDSVDGRLKMGPVWDFNLGFGNANYCDGWKTEGWAFNFNDVCPDDYFFMPFWWKRILEDRNFNEQLIEDWKELRMGKLSTPRLMACIDSLVTELTEAQNRNFQRWDIHGEWIWPNQYFGDNFSDDIFYLKDWLTLRLYWLDGNIEKLDEILSYRAAERGRFFTYPNPFKTSLTIEFHLPKDAPYRILFYNQQGKLIDQQKGQVVYGGDNTITWQPDLPVGIYFYQFWENDTLHRVGKLVKF